MLDFVEIMSNVEYTTTYFPEAMLETVRSTSLPLFMANVHCLMSNTVKTQWMKESHIKEELNRIRKQVQQIALEVCITILDVAMIRCIGVHSRLYAVVQSTIASQLKSFILGVTGNIEMSKDLLHKNSNFMVKDAGKSGCRFLRKVMEYKDEQTKQYKFDLIGSISSFEDRFMDAEDRDFLVKILKSLARGNTVQIKSTDIAPMMSKAAGSKQEESQLEKLNP